MEKWLNHIQGWMTDLNVLLSWFREKMYASAVATYYVSDADERAVYCDACDSGSSVPSVFRSIHLSISIGRSLENDVIFHVNLEWILWRSEFFCSMPLLLSMRMHNDEGALLCFGRFYSSQHTLPFVCMCSAGIPSLYVPLSLKGPSPPKKSLFVPYRTQRCPFAVNSSKLGL